MAVLLMRAIFFYNIPIILIGILPSKGPKIMESHFRSIFKAITWSTGGTVVTFAVAWILSRDLSLSAGIGLSDTTIKIGGILCPLNFI